MPEPTRPGPPEGERELMNMSQLAGALGVTRQWLHSLRTRDPHFPSSQRQPGSTREVWDLVAVRSYYEAREKKPGERTDLKRDRNRKPEPEGK